MENDLHGSRCEPCETRYESPGPAPGGGAVAGRETAAGEARTNRPSREWLRKERLVLLAWWTAASVIRATGLHLGNLNRPGVTYLRSLGLGFHDMYGWGALSLVALVMARRFPLRPHGLRRSLAVQLLLSLVVVALRQVVDIWIVRYVWMQREFPMARYFLFRYDTHFFVFVLVLAAAHGVEYLRRFRQQELAAERLRADLAHARLQMLRTQLQPHLVFNALNTVSGLMTHDVAAARRMITRLADFLRTVVDAPAEEECTLAEELDSVEAYVDIQRIRFADRLSVEFRVTSEARGRRVPRFILQPLVENSIQHGIGTHAAEGGSIVVFGRVEDGVLSVGVADDGAGAGEVREGIGLSNTRQRLRWLYGDGGALTFTSGPAGSVATVTLPTAELNPPREVAQ